MKIKTDDENSSLEMVINDEQMQKKIYKCLIFVECYVDQCKKSSDTLTQIVNG